MLVHLVNQWLAYKRPSPTWLDLISQYLMLIGPFQKNGPICNEFAWVEYTMYSTTFETLYQCSIPTYCPAQFLYEFISVSMSLYQNIENCIVSVRTVSVNNDLIRVNYRSYFLIWREGITPFTMNCFCFVPASSNNSNSNVKWQPINSATVWSYSRGLVCWPSNKSGLGLMPKWVPR